MTKRILLVIVACAFLVFLVIPGNAEALTLKKSKYFDPPEGTSEKAIELIAEVEKLMEKGRKTDKVKEFNEIGEEMLKTAKKAAREAPKWAVPPYYICIAYQWLQKNSLAKKYAEEAIDLEPEWHEAWLELGDIYSHMDEFDKAEETYDKLIKMKPDYYKGYIMKGAMYLKQKKLKEALPLIKKGSELEIEDQEEKKRYADLVDNIERELNMGKKWASKYEEESEHYIVYTSISQEFAKRVSDQLELVYLAYTKIFPKNRFGKQDKLKVFMHGTRQEYLDHGAPQHSGGYFSPMSKQISIPRYSTFESGMAVLYHEAFHQFLDTHLQNVPLWYNEGHAEFYGAMEYLPETHQMKFRPNGTRLPAIQKMLSSGYKLPSLKELSCMTNKEFYDRKTMSRNYAHAWSFVYFCWIYKNGKYMKYMKKFFKALQKEKMGEEASDYAFRGANWTVMEREWKGFIMSLKQGDASPPMR